MINTNPKSTEKPQFVHVTSETFSNLLSTMTPSDLPNYLQIKREKQKLMKDIPLSRLFFLLERENCLNVISHQIHLSETIEVISGVIISDDIRRFRGLLLNIERAMIYFYIFYWVFRFLDDSKNVKLSLENYSLIWLIFEILWEHQFPYNLIRPAILSRPLPLNKIPEIQKIISFQQKSAQKIARSIERRKEIYYNLKDVKIIPSELAKTTGITGPIVRTSGALPASIKTSSYPTRKSSQCFLKYAYATDNNMLNLLRVIYTELILAINQTSQLLKEYPVSSFDIQKSLNGEATSSFSTALGESHLTINIYDNQVTYFNFIPPQMINLTGVVKSLSTCPNSLRPIILLFFDPEIPFNLE